MMHADLILKNGRVFTVWDARPWVSCLAVKDGRILAVGEEPEITAHAGSNTEIIDLGGHTTIPGLTDSHIHLIHYGVHALWWADLSPCRSISDVIEKLREHAEARPSEWILGGGFDDQLFAERRFPTREELDEVSREKPVLISRLCGHACVVNSKAIELAGPDRLPASGRATGLLTEDDMDPVWEKMPDRSVDELIEATLFAASRARKTGITAVHCLINSKHELEAIRRLHESGRLPIRFYVQISYRLFSSLVKQGIRTGSGDDMCRIGSVKLFADGSMGARTAALTEDFADDPGNKGILLYTDDKMKRFVRRIHDSGCQAAIHAIGDRAVEQAVDAIECALNATGESNLDRRHRVEHASLLSESLVERMARLKIVAAVQPQFVLTDFWTRDRLGAERYRWAYPFRTMLDRGIPMSLGSDCPVESLDAFQLIYRAVVRDEYSRDECLSVEDTIRLYAQGGAYSEFSEKSRGSLEPGRLADIVVLDRDIFNIPPSRIEDCRADLVFVGGKSS